jgi:hypothetical protein
VTATKTELQGGSGSRTLSSPAAPAAHEFLAYGERRSVLELNREVRRKIAMAPTASETQAEDGWIYGYTIPSVHTMAGAAGMHIKIGRTNNLQRRMWAVRRACHYDPQLLFSFGLPMHQKYESIVHLALHNQRRREAGCPGCGKGHREWRGADTGGGGTWMVSYREHTLAFMPALLTASCIGRSVKSKGRIAVPPATSMCVIHLFELDRFIDDGTGLQLFALMGSILKAYLLSRCALAAPYMLAAVVVQSIFVLKAVLVPLGIVFLPCLFACRARDYVASWLTFLRLPLAVLLARCKAVFLQEVFVCMSSIPQHP